MARSLAPDSVFLCTVYMVLYHWAQSSSGIQYYFRGWAGLVDGPGVLSSDHPVRHEIKATNQVSKCEPEPCNMDYTYY